MSKFNTKDSPSKAYSHEGNLQYKTTSIDYFMNYLFSSYMEDSFYENANTQRDRFRNVADDVIDEYGPEFAAKACLFARNELGIRSATHYLAAMLNDERFESGKRSFFRQICRRADDPAEIFSAINNLGGRRSHAAVRGIGDYLSGLDAYQLTKYHMSGRKFNMFDLINITHAHSHNIDLYKRGIADKADTWENSVSSQKSREENDREWLRLLRGRRMGYLALVRNINNLMNAIDDIGASDDLDSLCEQLVDEIGIRKSLIYPYQIYSAYKHMKVRNSRVIAALEDAFRVACHNVPKQTGKSVIILDVSGSMGDPISSKSNLSIKEVGACYAAALYLTQDCDFVKFGTVALRQSYNKLDNPFDIVRKMCANDDCNYGTNIHSAFGKLDQAYDRVFIVSDEQTMERPGYKNRWGSNDYDLTFYEYCNAYMCSPHVYSFNLGHYNTGVVNPNDPKVHCLTFMSGKVFDLIPYIENGGNNLVSYIESKYTL